MARIFTKNTSNYMTLPSGTIGALINGAAAVSIGVWLRPRSTNGGGDANENAMLAVARTSNAGLRLNLDGTVAGGGHYLRIGSRSADGDSFQAKSSAEQVYYEAWQHCGGVANYESDLVTPYLRGAAQPPLAASFANSYYAHPGAHTETIGVAALGNAGQHIAADAEGLAIWRTDIGADGFRLLASGVHPLSVCPASLVFYMVLDGDATSEIDLISGKLGTVVGSVPPVDGPYMRISDDDQWLLPFLAGGAPATAFPWHYYAGQMSA